MNMLRTMEWGKRALAVIVAMVVLAFGALCGCADSGASQSESADTASSVTASYSSQLQESASTPSSASGVQVSEDGSYTSKDEVAAYIHEYGHLPKNYISKTKARKAGWFASKGNLDEVCPGMSIGGGPFHNDEGILPNAPDRTWNECDINYTGGHRNAERIVYSNDGLIFYTDDHYRTFTQLY